MRTLITLVATIVLASLAPLPAQSQKPLDIYFIDVEGGQATLFVTPSGESMLIDTGHPGNGDRDLNRVLATIKQASITRLDYLLITHYHSDHVGNAAAIAAALPVGTFIDHGPTVGTSPSATALYEASAHQGKATVDRQTTVNVLHLLVPVPSDNLHTPACSQQASSRRILPSSSSLRSPAVNPGVGTPLRQRPKPATVETGATVSVPLSVVGDTIKIDTRTHEYVERVNKSSDARPRPRDRRRHRGSSARRAMRRPGPRGCGSPGSRRRRSPSGAARYARPSPYQAPGREVVRLPRARMGELRARATALATCASSSRRAASRGRDAAAGAEPRLSRSTSRRCAPARLPDHVARVSDEAPARGGLRAGSNPRCASASARTSAAPHHASEFTMVEWYRAYAGSTRSSTTPSSWSPRSCAAITGRPVARVGGRDIDVTPPWPRMTVRAAMQRVGGRRRSTEPSRRAISSRRPRGRYRRRRRHRVGRRVLRGVPRARRARDSPRSIARSILEDWPAPLAALARRSPTIRRPRCGSRRTSAASSSRTRSTS